MSSKVITYENPKALDKLAPFLEYTKALHICATQNLRDGVYERYQKKRGKQALIKAPILVSGPFIDFLAGRWSNAEVNLEQYLRLTELIKARKETPDFLRNSFRRNQVDVLDTLRKLHFLGITPEDLGSTTLSEREEFLKELWEELRHLQSFTSLRENLQPRSIHLKLAEPKNLQHVIEETYKNEDGQVEPKYLEDFCLDTLVLHGFYYLAPEQQYVFKLIEEAGIHVIFLNLYNESYKNTFDFIGQFLCAKNGWQDKDNWIMQTGTLKPVELAHRFLKDFEGGASPISVEQGDLRLIKYEDFYDFLGDFQQKLPEIQSGKQTILAPNARSLNERLQEYYPELYQHKRHFLSYPVGQFLYQLHKMWDSDRGGFTLSGSGLFECFSSGWLYDSEKKTNAKNYTKVLQDLLPFFSGCETEEQWDKACQNLRGIYQDTLSLFENPAYDRFQNMVRSPLVRIGHFSQNQERVHQVLQFIDTVFRFAKRVFGDGKQRISLTEHFRKLREILEDAVPHLEVEMRKEERELIDGLKERLQANPQMNEFLIDDISEAIQLYLSGKLTKEKETETKGKIRPFIEVDGEAFKENEITHVTGLDENSLPYSEFSLPWPIGKDTFIALSQKSQELSLEITRNHNVKKITRYLMYNLLQFTHQLELSWMTEYEEKANLDKAVYLTQLSLEPEVSARLEEDDFEYIQPTERELKDQIDRYTAYPDDAKAEFLFCPRRFYYSFLATPYATFESDFIHETLFGELLKGVKSLTNQSDEDVKQNVYPLFPYWTDFKKNAIAEDNLSYHAWAHKYYGEFTQIGSNTSFSDLRKLFQFPRINKNNKDEDYSEVAERIKKLYNTPEEVLPGVRKELQVQFAKYPEQMEAKPSEKCRYCPHIQFCPDAHHPVDDERRMGKV